jgi:uncharacterized membrane protein YphA (DoxX/SURF4 family)
MKQFVTALRVIAGLLFIFSGLIKANDPSGLAYKMDEYFAIWHWNRASAYSLYASIFMNVLEIVAGIALLLGLWPKLTTRALFWLIVFFTFLTGYAVITGTPKTCGCFGDCIPLQANQSFAKDILLLLVMGFLVWQYRHIRPWMGFSVNLLLVALATGLAFWGQVYVLQHLPFVDCLPYAKGKNLLQQMKPPPGSVPDSMVVLFTYRHNGQTVQFDASNFPADFDESSYEFVGREEKLIRKGNGDPAIKDFALFTTSKTDTTTALLSSKGPYLLCFLRNFSDSEPSADWQIQFGKLYLKTLEEKIPLLVVTNQAEAVENWLNRTNRFQLPVLSCDGTVMKTFLRSRMGLVGMEGPVVSGKWAMTDMQEAMVWINQVKRR